MVITWLLPSLISTSERDLVSSDPVPREQNCQVLQPDNRHLDLQNPTIANDFSLLATPLLSPLHSARPDLARPTRRRPNFGKPSLPPRSGLLLAFGTSTKSAPAPHPGNHGNSLPHITHGHQRNTVLREQPKLLVCSVQFNSLPNIASVTGSNSTVQTPPPLQRAPCL